MHPFVKYLNIVISKFKYSVPLHKALAVNSDVIK